MKFEDDIKFEIHLSKYYCVCNLASSTITVYDYYRQSKYLNDLKLA